MPGISPNIICHRLSIDPKTKLVRQKRRSYDAERYEAIKAEVKKLKGIGFIYEVNYPTWVANVVLVKENPTKEGLQLQKVLWRMCVDYTNLNKGCPKDSFPLPLIDRLIDSTAGCELLSFMDAYSGYNQILMNPPDQEHTAFTTERGLYCYKVMPFGLKNARATYQRLVNSMIAEQIWKSMEVYVDDMLVKRKHVDQHITNLSETFTILKRFISKATDRCALFFKALKASKKYITWTDECAKAFKNLKDYMSKAHWLSKPEVGDTLIIDLSVSASAILQSPDTSGRMIKRAIALGEFDISYQPKPAEKGQTVADFITDFTYPVDIVYTPKEVVSLPSEAQKIEPTTPTWSLYVNGSSNQHGCGAGLVFTTPDKVAIEYALRFKFKASNNEAEYEALLVGLRLAKHLRVKRIDIFSDSQLVVNQVTNNFDAKESSTAAYLAQT
ncbi:hypothetical protein ACFX1Z_032225 [Malus domestica]